MVEWLAGNRIRGTSTERTTGAGFNPVDAVSGGWKEVGRITLGSAAMSYSVSSLPSKRYLMLLRTWGGSTSAYDRFNNDSGSNYAARYHGGTDYTVINRSAYPWQNGGYSTTPNFSIDYISNLAGKEKLILRNWMYQYTAGAGNAPRRAEVVAKWANTSDAINSISSLSGTTNWTSGSEIVVLGWDPDDTHTTNFWEELADVTMTSAGDTLDSGTFTAKKYIWYQMWADPTGAAAPHIRHNADSTGTQAGRYSQDGATDGTSTSSGSVKITGANLAANQPMFVNGFMVNISGNEKLHTGHTVQAKAAGAGTAPSRSEYAGKWTNTSTQCTQLQLLSLTGNWNIGSQIKVWGSN